MTTGTILDIVVILLLIPTITYAVILNRRLTALRRSREELSKVVNSFNEATMRAEAGIPKLKKATTEANHTLKDRVEKAQTLRDDLAFMIERAEELANRLEGAVRSARNEGVVTHGPAAAPANTYAVAAAPQTSRPLGEAAPPAREGAHMLPAREGAHLSNAGLSPARGFTLGNPGSGAGTPANLTAATLAQTAAGFEETAAELRNALGAARAEARVAEARGGNAARDTREAGPIPAREGLHLFDAGLPPVRSKRTIGERPLADRARAGEPGVDEERSEAERELLKALQSAR